LFPSDLFLTHSCKTSLKHLSFSSKTLLFCDIICNSFCLASVTLIFLFISPWSIGMLQFYPHILLSWWTTSTWIIYTNIVIVKVIPMFNLLIFMILKTVVSSSFWNWLSLSLWSSLRKATVSSNSTYSKLSHLFYITSTVFLLWCFQLSKW
jgi:hypothetical protein